jgi:hypothetical protein
MIFQGAVRWEFKSIPCCSVIPFQQQRKQGTYSTTKANKDARRRGDRKIIHFLQPRATSVELRVTKNYFTKKWKVSRSDTKINKQIFLGRFSQLVVKLMQYFFRGKTLRVASCNLGGTSCNKNYFTKKWKGSRSDTKINKQIFSGRCLQLVFNQMKYFFSGQPFVTPRATSVELRVTKNYFTKEWKVSRSDTKVNKQIFLGRCLQLVFNQM